MAEQHLVLLNDALKRYVLSLENKGDFDGITEVRAVNPVASSS